MNVHDILLAPLIQLVQDHSKFYPELIHMPTAKNLFDYADELYDIMQTIINYNKTLFKSFHKKIKLLATKFVNIFI